MVDAPMSEPMLTREQIEELEVDAEAAAARPAKVSVDPITLSALCTLALSSIAMREALKPFADQANKFHWVTKDMEEGTFLWTDGRSMGAKISIGDLRRAAEAYQEQGK